MRRYALSAILLALLILLSACQTTAAETTTEETPAEGPLEGTISEVSKHGNAVTTITEAEAEARDFTPGDIVTVTVRDYSDNIPLGTAYSDVDRGNALAVIRNGIIELAVGYGSFADLAGASQGDTVMIEMHEKEGYLDQYNIRHLTGSDKRSDFESDEIFANFRTVQAGNIIPGRLYRSSSPILDNSRGPYALSLMEDAGIKTVINLADNEEESIPYINAAPCYKELYDEGSVIFLDMSVVFFNEDNQEKTAEALRFIISNDGPYLVHCHEGKDRAGLVSALIEALCGANIQQIISDYMRSYVNYYSVEPGSKQYELISKTITDFFVTMNGRPFPWNGIGTVAENYAIGTLGLSHSEIELLRAKLTH